MGKQRAVRPTRKQKEVIKSHNLKPDNWFVVKEQEGFITIQNKKTQRIRNIATVG